MANKSDTLAGLIVLNDQNLSDVEVTDVLSGAPLLNALYAQPASQGGTLHKYMRETALPGAAFRAIGAGLDNAAGEDEEVTVTCKLLDASFSRDKALALGYRKGVAAFMARESLRSLRKAFNHAEKQLVNGVSNDASGFIGFLAYVASLSVDNVVNAGGSGGKSVYVLRTAQDGVSLIAGNDGKFDVSEVYSTRLYVTTSQYRPDLAQDILGWLGLQFGSSVLDIVRIANVDGTSSHALTDDFLSKAIAKFPSDKPANLIVMNRTALQELQESRTGTNPTGAPAPFPDSAFNIPIVVTDALGSSETAVTSTTTTTTTT